MSLPSRTISIKIGENEYEVKFPNNGALIEIEQLKINLSKGTHDTMANVPTVTAERAYLTIEAISTFSVLIPSLKKDLNKASLLELDPYESKQIVNAYIKQFFPWYKQWMDLINKDEDEK